MNRAIARIAYEIMEHNRGAENLCIVGLYTRGVAIAGRIAKKIREVEGRDIPVGKLDITGYRDDRVGTKENDRTEMDFSVEDKRVVLVDDVIFTGRSIRAALDAVMSRGRPKGILLAVLVDRGHRELPIRADFVGKNLPTARNEKIRVLVTEIDGQDGVILCKE